MNIALIGPRGSGKSKLSAELARLSGFSVFSTDTIAVQKSGMPVADQVAKWGWKKFRNLEYEILKSLEHRGNAIIDCGGGILFDLDENSQEIFSERKSSLLKSMATIVYLVRPEAYDSESITGDPARPGLDKEKSYSEILEFRLPWYSKMADYTYNISQLTPREAADIIYREVIKK